LAKYPFAFQIFVFNLQKEHVNHVVIVADFLMKKIVSVCTN